MPPSLFFNQRFDVGEPLFNGIASHGVIANDQGLGKWLPLKFVDAADFVAIECQGLAFDEFV